MPCGPTLRNQFGAALSQANRRRDTGRGGLLLVAGLCFAGGVDGMAFNRRAPNIRVPPESLACTEWGTAMSDGSSVSRCVTSPVRAWGKGRPVFGVLVIVIVLALAAPKVTPGALSVLVAGLAVLAPYWLARGPIRARA